MYIEIKSSDKYGESQRAKYRCQRELTGGIMKYLYKDENGENLLLFSDKIELIRKTEVESRLVLEKGKETLFSYRNEYMDTEFKVFTEKLDFLEKGAAVKYFLSDNSGLINIIEMEISEVEWFFGADGNLLFFNFLERGNNEKKIESIYDSFFYNSFSCLL